MSSRPVPDRVMVMLSNYVRNLEPSQEKLFKTKFNYRIWRKICKNAGLLDLKFHDLRKYADTIIMPSRFAFSYFSAIIMAF